VDVGALLRGLVETYPNLQPPLAEIRIEIEHLLVSGNEAALTQIFSNLLGNAVKFIAPGTKPRVRVWADFERCPPGILKEPHDCAYIWVEDNGIGIPQYAHEKIFTMFNRMHRADEYPGTGVGLALVKKSLERIGGKIRLESEPGKGSRFCVQLPLAVQETREESLSA
jgi:signal transduction histidine kinase